MPELLGTIEVAQMAKSPSNGLSAADKALRDTYNNFITSTPDGLVGVIQLVGEETVNPARRGVKTRLRYAAKRVGRNIVKMADEGDTVQYEMGAVVAAKSK